MILLFCLTSYINKENLLLETDIQEESQLRLSAPNNSLFHEYDFESDIIGQDPTEFTLNVNEATGCTANIEDIGDGQQKHLALNKVGSVGRVWVRDNFSQWNNKTYTTGEYHLKVYHDNSGFGINLNSANMEYILAMVWWNGEIRDDVGGTLLATYTLNQWLDVIIYFDLSLGWMFDLDGVRYGNGYSLPFFGAFTANAEHIWITSFVSGGGDGYFRIDDIAFYPINITTPENKTYYSSMDGYYPATFGFENDKPGESPEGWDLFSMDGSSFVEVDSNLDGHNNVVEIRKNGGFSSAGMENNFDFNVSIGAVEFWLYKDTDSGIDATFFTVVTTDGFLGNAQGVILDKDFYYMPSGFGSRILVASDIININTWHHLSIEFNILIGWQITIDGILYGQNYALPFMGGVTGNQMKNFHVQSLFSGGASNYGSWVDAIGYSWDPNYGIGDSLNEGLLLSYENQTALDWKAYSLDGKPYRTILGNTTIPMPGDGLHSIQVFGNDSLGNIHRSDIRYFTVDFPIDIITPEAKSYSAPMSGYYPGTYGFEDVLDDTTPAYVEYDAFGTSPDWVNSYTKVINKKIDGAGNKHNKVLLLKDATNLGVCLSYFNFTDYGSEIARNSTFEFYHLLNIPGTHYISRIVFSGNYGNLFQINFDTNALVIKYINSTGWYSTGLNLVRDRWYRYSIDISCDGGYAGLSANQFRFRIYDDKGILIYTSYDMDFETSYPTGGPNRITMTSSETQTQVYQYLDAFSITGLQDNYEIGDNLNEGLLLSYENSTNLDWIGYSLDGQQIKTILGNTTFSFPEDGRHSIRVFGNDSVGTVYQSTSRYFSTHHISIVTPEDKVYNSPMNGYYPGTYGFENDKPGESPEDWVLTPMDGSSFVEVDSNLDGHNNVVEIRKNGGSTTAGIRNDFDVNVSIETVEFWLYKDTDSGTDATFFSIVSTDGFLGNAQGVILNRDFYYMPSDFGSRILVASDIINISTWHHLSIEFNISVGWQITIDGILYGQNYALPFRGGVTGNQMNLFAVQSLFSGGASNYGSWVDAIGYSWDPYYNIGDNLNEGLLLSYENSTALNWTGYALDHQPITTILGNITIPMPSDGLHSIQIFGSDSLGTMYQSSIRYFTVSQIVDLIAPDITINLPGLNALFGSDAPSFGLTIIETNLNFMWYTLDGGLVNTTFSVPTGIINQTLWNNRPNGTVSIMFYADDLTGNLGFEEVEVRKDTLAPQITIRNPDQNQVFHDTAPNFDLTIIEGNLDAIWYTMDEGIINFTCGLSGVINSAYWGAIPPGDYTLIFYARDTLGNVGFSEVIIKKREPSIPAYNSLLLSLASILGITFIILKFKKKIKS